MESVCCSTYDGCSYLDSYRKNSQFSYGPLFHFTLFYSLAHDFWTASKARLQEANNYYNWLQNKALKNVPTHIE